MESPTAMTANAEDVASWSPTHSRIERGAALPSSRRVLALDGLRGCAILLVLLYHTVFSTFTTSNTVKLLHRMGSLSWSGVDLFFVLSGFLIGGILIDTRNSPRFFRTFYARRAYRILPLYGIIVLLYALWLIRTRWTQGAWGEPSLRQVPFWAYLVFTQNLWTAHGWTEIMVAGVTWSLAVEEQFYLTLPLLMRRVRLSTLTWILGAVVVGAPLLRTVIHYGFKNGNVADYVLMPCRADALCLGVLVAILVRTPRFWKPLTEKPHIVYAAFAVALAGPAWLTYQGYDLFANGMVEIGYSLLAIFYTSCLLLALTASGSAQKVFENRTLRELGTVSYCVYLIHISVVEGCRRALASQFGESTKPTHFLSLVIGVTLVLIIAKLSWRFFEQPMLRRGHAFRY